MSSPVFTAGKAGDDLADALRGVLRGLALEVRARATCKTCGCLLRPLEVCPSCFPRIYRERALRRARAQSLPGGIVVPAIADPARERQALERARERAGRNFARTA